ncbi:Phr family secreted Rap phosphatase inhibitor [Bacillus sp. C1]
MFKKIKKVGSVVLGLSVIGIVSAGLYSSFTYQAGHADTPAPQRPDLAVNIGDGGGAPAENHGDSWSSSYTHGHTGIVSNEAEGDTPAPAYDHGQPWGVADGDTGSPAENKGETII